MVQNYVPNILTDANINCISHKQQTTFNILIDIVFNNKVSELHT